MAPPSLARLRLARDGGSPVRAERLPYARQEVTEADIAAVVRVLRSPWLTTGPEVAAFESALARAVGAREAVSFSSGTAALHGAAAAAGIGPGDEVIVPPLTFCATANCVLYQGGTLVFADVAPETLTLDPEAVASAVTSRTKAIIAVDYAGHPAALDALERIAQRHGLWLIEDACHALGARWQGRPVGSISRLTAFSFHPVKHITTGEGGMVTTSDPQAAAALRRFRNHGIDRDASARQAEGTWVYEVNGMGYNYRLSDLQAALGRSQLARLPQLLARRRVIAARYLEALAGLPGLQLPSVAEGAEPAWHLFPVRIDAGAFGASRDAVIQALWAEGIGANVHYRALHRRRWYREHPQVRRTACPVAEDASDRVLSLPLFAAMSEADAEDVIAAMRKVVSAFRARPGSERP